VCEGVVCVRVCVYVGSGSIYLFVCVYVYVGSGSPHIHIHIWFYFVIICFSIVFCYPLPQMCNYHHGQTLRTMKEKEFELLRIRCRSTTPSVLNLLHQPKHRCTIIIIIIIIVFDFYLCR